jgi:tRNA dimethylallyltransferase
MDQKTRIIAIVGQTATGKSDLAVKLAHEFQGEVVSADSRQVYRGLDIGTGKITNEEMQGIPHHLLDVANPNSVYSVSDFVRDAERAISEIAGRGNLPILCGGTGYYVDALVKGKVFPSVPPNRALREQLSGCTLQELNTMLRARDPLRHQTIDQKNPVRLIRAIEIVVALGHVPKEKEDSPYDALTIGIATDTATLHTRIRTRLTRRLSEGMIEEVLRLHERGLSYERMEALGLEYRFIARHLQGILSREEMEHEIFYASVHYAKRQMTWFKRDQNIKWFSLDEYPKIVGAITNHLR